MSELDFLRYIQFYRERGWYMLPVQGKIPLTAHGLTDASIEEHVLKSWWGINGRFNGSNVAIRTGEGSNLVVLDVDTKNGGDESYEKLFQGKLPITPTVRTGSGGLHFYFLWKPLANSAGKIAPGIDFRGGIDGKDGYVVAPPSLHPDTGLAYEWEILPSEVAVAELPEFLLELIKASGKKAPLDFGPGKRNTSLTSLAGTLYREGIAPAQMKEMLMAAGSQREGLEESEVDHIVEQTANWDGVLPPQTEIGQAEMIAAEYGEQVAYDKNRQTWLMWGTQQWEETGDVYHYVKEGARLLGKRIQATADKVSDDEAREKFLKGYSGWIRALESARGVDAVTKVLKSEVGKDHELNKNPLLLGVPNGVVNLQTGELLPGIPSQWITRCTTVSYNKDAVCPRWEKFLVEIFCDREGKERPELADFVHRAVGYSITGDIGQQCWFLCLGEGANGKGTFLGTLVDVLGTYAQKLMIETITVRAARRGISNDVADLSGPRFLLSGEAGTTVELNSERLKDLVGSDSRIRAQMMYKEDIEFRMVGKIWMPNNHLPRTNDDTPGFWRRVMALPFERTFSIDNTLRAELETEWEGILAWAVRGTQEFLQRGLEAPEVVQTLVRTVRNSSDPLASWYAESIAKVEGGKARAGQIFPSYVSWSIANGIGDRERVGRRRVKEYMVMRHGEKHDVNGEFYPGVEVKRD